MTTTETPGPWTEYIHAMDQALAETNATAAVRAWRNAYAAALGMPGRDSHVAPGPDVHFSLVNPAESPLRLPPHASPLP